MQAGQVWPKPLFYCSFGNNFYFASEIKALFAAGCERRPSKVAWRNYLTSAKVEEGKHTFFNNIFQLKLASFKKSGGSLSFENTTTLGIKFRHWVRL